ncbi:cell wall metabolism sensor histidine kinase WalK [Pseudoruegeria sp. HB172150]|uniref:sensor histidine kinase n=1 Tax=Pseudoruegeria sp. HB172150 TaxID=2721164 RepID=UPI0015582749|nr:HAMP domain-containing sensor histidine kinase [Pseudoruegeria sp. HB172150]
MNSGFSALRWLAALGLMVALGLSAAGLMTMRSELGALSNTKRTGAIWIANQLEFELFRFTQTVALFMAQDPRVDAEDVVFRFDILWSRHSVAEMADNGKPVAGDWPEAVVLADLGEQLREDDPLVLGLESGDVETARVLLTHFEAFAAPLHDYTLVVKDVQAQEDMDARQEIWRLSKLTVAFSAALGIGSVLLAILFFVDSRVQRQISKENMVLLKRSEAAYTARIEFLSTVSHELRTPLTSIKGVLGFLKAGVLGDLDSKAHRMIQIAHSNAVRLEKLIDDILDSVKAERGEWTFDFEQLDLVKVAEGVVTANASVRIDRTIRFRNAASGPVMVFADRGRIEQVLSNLISNAVKFSESDTEVVVTVRSEGEHAVASVKDSGAGIPEAFRGRIFEKFAQADSSDKRRAGGTGLGLNIAKRIVESHNGKIYFESEPGKGSIFTFELPLLKDAVREKQDHVLV